LRYVGELEGQGRHLEAAERLARLLEQDDLDEDALRAYMSALFRAGRQARALRAYEDFAKHLQ
jgi:DNA-binding SARP family transcriptional activator